MSRGEPDGRLETGDGGWDRRGVRHHDDPLSPVPRPPSPVRCVIFDCDSTLSDIEGIEELAREHRDEVARLTEAAMRGEVPLEQVYGRRLALLRPTREDVARVAELYVRRLVPDALEVVRGLQDSGLEVRVVSGGLLPAVRAATDALGIPGALVFAVDVRFDADGRYAGFDDQSPLARSRGKRDLIASWGDLARPCMMVGDGATDLEAREVVDCFVAYAGVVARPNVVAAADVVVWSRSLAPVFTLAHGGIPPERPALHDLFHRGQRLLDGGPPSQPGPRAQVRS